MASCNSDKKANEFLLRLLQFGDESKLDKVLKGDLLSSADFCQEHRTFTDPDREVYIIKNIPWMKSQASTDEIQALPMGPLGGAALLTPTASYPRKIATRRRAPKTFPSPLCKLKARLRSGHSNAILEERTKAKCLW